MLSPSAERPPIKLRTEITCLHCWERFPPEQVVWISEHRDLIGDPLLGDVQRRFLPSRFTVEGNALDARGLTCHEIGCPRCHLPLPRSLLEFQPAFVSVLGSPSCGKSYYLASMIWSLRKSLPSTFALSFSDADAVSNQIVSGYEERLFLNEEPQQHFALADLIAKTSLAGDLYNRVNYGELKVSYPRPFSFLMQPAQGHPHHDDEGLARILCLYDNAGEHFLPGQDSATAPGTRHLAESSLLLFLYDPTQDRRFDAAIDGVQKNGTAYRTRHAGRQEGILQEAAVRIQRYLNLPRGQKHKRPLVIVVTKCDVWKALHPCADWSLPWIRSTKNNISVVDRGRIDQMSKMTRQFIQDHVPEIVQTAESFAEVVYYLPVSALGCSPKLDQKGTAWVRPAEIRPTWVEVPMVFGLGLSTRNLIMQAVPVSKSK